MVPAAQVADPTATDIGLDAAVEFCFVDFSESDGCDVEVQLLRGDVTLRGRVIPRVEVLQGRRDTVEAFQGSGYKAAANEVEVTR